MLFLVINKFHTGFKQLNGMHYLSFSDQSMSIVMVNIVNIFMFSWTIGPDGHLSILIKLDTIREGYIILRDLRSLKWDILFT